MNKAHKLFKVGLIGTGRISDIYLQNCLKFDGISVDVCGSLNLQESEEKAQKFGVPRVAHPDAIISDPGIDCILNLTIPAAHADISLRSLMRENTFILKSLLQRTRKMPLKSLN